MKINSAILYVRALKKKYKLAIVVEYIVAPKKIPEVLNDDTLLIPHIFPAKLNQFILMCLSLGQIGDICHHGQSQDQPASMVYLVIEGRSFMRGYRIYIR